MVTGFVGDIGMISDYRPNVVSIYLLIVQKTGNDENVIIRY